MPQPIELIDHGQSKVILNGVLSGLNEPYQIASYPRLVLLGIDIKTCGQAVSHSFNFAVLSATNRRDTEDFVVARLAWPARSPSGSRTERAYLRVATPISIWLNAQRDSKSAFWIALQLGSSSSAPRHLRTLGRRTAAWPPCQPTSLPIMPHR